MTIISKNTHRHSHTQTNPVTQGFLKFHYLVSLSLTLSPCYVCKQTTSFPLLHTAWSHMEGGEREAMLFLFNSELHLFTHIHLVLDLGSCVVGCGVDLLSCLPSSLFPIRLDIQDLLG